MEINNLTQILAEALAGDSALATFTQATYGQKHKVFVGCDLNDPPRLEDCPYLLLFPGSKGVGLSRERKTHGYEVVACVYEAAATAQTSLTNLYSLAGVAHLESLRALAQSAIATAATDNAVLEIVDIIYEPLEQFPFMFCGMSLELVETTCIGGNYFV